MRRSPRTGDALGEGGPGVVPLELHALGRHGWHRAGGGPCAAARRRCSGRTTGTACGAWGRSRPTDAVTEALGVCCLPMATHSFASSAMPRVSCPVSVGRPMRKYSFMPRPALRVRRLDRAVQVVLGDELVDDGAQAPRARLGREREAGAASRPDRRGDADSEGVDPQAREGHRHLATVDRIVDHVGDHALDAAEVGGRQRSETHLVVAGATQSFAHHRADLRLGPLTHGTRDHARLAEPAAARAAAEDLDVEPVVHDLGERDELVAGYGQSAKSATVRLTTASGTSEYRGVTETRRSPS